MLSRFTIGGKATPRSLKSKSYFGVAMNPICLQDPKSVFKIDFGSLQGPENHVI